MKKIKFLLFSLILMGSFIEPSYKTDETFDGDFNAREGSVFEDDDDDDF